MKLWFASPVTSRKEAAEVHAYTSLIGTILSLSHACYELAVLNLLISFYVFSRCLLLLVGLMQ
jgi:hypothetical protein